MKYLRKNPKGYLKYFKEILTEHSMVGVQFNKRLYVIKHYILFCTLNKVKPSLGEIKGFLNKVLIVNIIYTRFYYG